MSVGKSILRVDAYEKVTGRAKYTEDMTPKGALWAKVVRSTIANGQVKRFDLTKALEVPGVVKIVTCFDVPEIDFPTAGHPWSTDKSHQDVADRRLLNRRVRIYGDDIAAIIAEDSVAAERAARLVEVEYETYPPILTVAEALAPEATQLHDYAPGNLMKHTQYRFPKEAPSYEEAAQGEMVVSGKFAVQTVQHCHLELPVSYAYMDNGRIVVVSSTQIPHIVRRVIGQALGIPWGKVRVIKPYIGGGFGNKQDVLYEPLNAFLTTQVGGRPVKMEISREETMALTRVRHAMEMEIDTAVRPDGTLVARRFKGYSNQGGYASHGHAIVANAANTFRHLYREEKVVEGEAYTVMTNIASGGAMRGYGIPQVIFALESHIDDLALKIGMDPLAFRRMNAMLPGYKDPGTGIAANSNNLRECLDVGAKHIGWEEKRKAYANQQGDKRRGVGMSIFSYKTGVYPISLETASARMMLNEDGSAQLLVGATEIGQGADTVLGQIASQACGLSMENIHLVSTQDTDVSPYDMGAYASRQTYVSGSAVKQTALLFRERIIEYAAEMLEKPIAELDIRNDFITDQTGKKLLSLGDLAMEAIYSLRHSVHITAETTYDCKHNTFSLGCTFAEVEVDIPLGKVKVLNVINVHDSGILINPQLAEAQVHGGMSMGLGYGLSEKLLYSKEGKPLNDNLLDYKLPTALDTPELSVAFVESEDPTGPYGNKALGEPPAIPVAPALRNAILHATGVAVNCLPLSPQNLVEHFMQAGLIG